MHTLRHQEKRVKGLLAYALTSFIRSIHLHLLGSSYLAVGTVQRTPWKYRAEDRTETRVQQLDGRSPLNLALLN
jgi:hypothetical protein